MTTAEPPVAAMVSAFRFLYPQQLSSGIVGSGGEAIVLSVYSVYSVVSLSFAFSFRLSAFSSAKRSFVSFRAIRGFLYFASAFSL
jgi:hypothetical protein